VREFSQVQGLWDQTVAHFGRCDIWINNAGVSHAGVVPIWEVEVSEIDNIVDVNTKGLLYGNKVAMTGMIKQGSGYIYNFVCLCLPAVFFPHPLSRKENPDLNSLPLCAGRNWFRRKGQAGSDCLCCHEGLPDLFHQGHCCGGQEHSCQGLRPASWPGDHRSEPLSLQEAP